MLSDALSDTTTTNTTAITTSGRGEREIGKEGGASLVASGCKFISARPHKGQHPPYSPNCLKAPSQSFRSSKTPGGRGIKSNFLCYPAICVYSVRWRTP